MADRALGVPAPGELAFHPLDLPPVTDGRLRVQTRFTGLSAGTELTYLKGTNPALHARWDAELGVFDHGAGAEGYPVRRLGYMEVGEVSESRAPGFAAGDLVAMTYGHATAHVADPLRERVVPLPPDLDPVLGVYVAHMGPICANGLLHAAAELAPGPSPGLGDGVRGRLVLVVGAGVVGLLCGLWARHLGAAEVAVADPSPRRLAAAAALGLTPVGDPEPWRALKGRWRHGPGDRGADVVLQCRGRVEALADALRCLRPQGAVIDLAFYTGGADALRLGEEFHHAGLTIRCAQIGRVPRGLAHAWDRERLSRETIALLRAHGPLVREHLIGDDVVPLDEAPALMRAVAAREREVLQAVFAVP
jgi:threonine dehydrogenase-like Zn-dependent dehydrogenase